MILNCKIVCKVYLDNFQLLLSCFSEFMILWYNVDFCTIKYKSQILKWIFFKKENIRFTLNTLMCP